MRAVPGKPGIISFQAAKNLQLSSTEQHCRSQTCQDASIHTAQIRRIRVDQRTIVHTDGPRINADAADLRGPRHQELLQKGKDLRVSGTEQPGRLCSFWCLGVLVVSAMKPNSPPSFHDPVALHCE